MRCPPFPPYRVKLPKQRDTPLSRVITDAKPLKRTASTANRSAATMLLLLLKVERNGVGGLRHRQLSYAHGGYDMRAIQPLKAVMMHGASVSRPPSLP